MNVTCPTCGHVGPADDRFCGGCGAPIGMEHTGSFTSISISLTGTGSGAMSPVGSAHQVSVPRGAALLVVLRGPNEGSEFLLDPVNAVHTVGRSPDTEVFLDDVTVSRHHAEFRHGAEGWSVRDIGSLNGTYVNRERVDDRQLRGGEEVQIGKFRFVFLVGVDGE